MARAVLNKRDELVMRNDRIVGPQFVENGADSLHNFDVSLLISSTDVISFANPSLGKDNADRLTMVRHKQPVADVLPVSIDRNRFSLYPMQNLKGINFSGNW